MSLANNPIKKFSYFLIYTINEQNTSPIYYSSIFSMKKRIKLDVTKFEQVNLRRIRKQNFPAVLSEFSLSAKSRTRSGKVRF